MACHILMLTLLSEGVSVSESTCRGKIAKLLHTSKYVKMTKGPR